MKNILNSDVAAVFNSYPENIRKKMMRLRKLVLDTASETEGVGVIEEALKWGEPSFLSKAGSTIRMDWKEKRPSQYALYFNCKTSLIDTFKELYGDSLKFEGNRAIVFDLNEKIPLDELKHCISIALTYHQRKHLPLLGV